MYTINIFFELKFKILFPFLKIILNNINFVKIKYKTERPKRKSKIKCNTFWRCIFLYMLWKCLNPPLLPTYNPLMCFHPK